MTATREPTRTSLDLGPLGLDDGGTVLLSQTIRRTPLVAGDVLDVRGEAPELAVHGRAWCRAKGHGFAPAPRGFTLTVGRHDADRSVGAERAGHADARRPDAIAEVASPRWGLAARGALVDAATPPVRFGLDRRVDVWADEAPALYAQATAAQWDPATAIPWDTACAHDPAVEDAIVQVMTYLVENETAALLVPARFLAQMHPHFREILQLLAVQLADEARHIEVFTRRARLFRDELGSSSAGGQASLQSLLDEPDYALAMFLLSVLGEGSFLSLLWFLHEHAPDAATKAVARLAAQDEARHVAFGLAHLERHLGLEPALRERLVAAVHRRHDALADTAGLNADVFDALVVIAAGSLAPAAIARGFAAVTELVHDMDRGRRRRLLRLGFPEAEAAALSELHTRNFM
jgi:hypothetical protein